MRTNVTDTGTHRAEMGFEPTSLLTESKSLK